MLVCYESGMAQHVGPKRKSPSTFAPKLYRDELLYSYIARIMHYRAWTTTMVQNHFFGVKRGDAGNPLLPRGLNAMAGRFHDEKFTADYLAWNHTLFPYFTAFRTPKKRRQTLMTMRLDRQAHARQGQRKSRQFRGDFVRVATPESWRFCSRCHETMIDDGNLLYWRRSHQIPIASFCTEHAEPLQVSNLRFDQSRQYILPDEINCPVDAPTVLSGSRCPDLALWWDLTRDAVDLLTSGDRGSDDWLALPATLAELGFVRGNGQYSWKEVTAASSGFLEIVSELFPRVLGNDDLTETWLMKLFMGETAATSEKFLIVKHLLRHLPNRPQKNYFGEGPWECRNPLSAHKGEKTIETLKLVSRYTDGQFAVFECHCGYSYTRRSYPDGSVSPPRMKKFGPSLRILADFAKDRDLTPHQTAAIIGMNPISLLNTMKREGLQLPWTKLPKGFRGKTD